MQWSYHLRSTILATTSNFKMAVEIGVFRLIREALYFFSLIFSSQRTRELYYLLWELQIDVSIIYSLSIEFVHFWSIWVLKGWVIPPRTTSFRILKLSLSRRVFTSSRTYNGFDAYNEITRGSLSRVLKIFFKSILLKAQKRLLIFFEF